MWQKASNPNQQGQEKEKLWVGKMNALMSKTWKILYSSCKVINQTKRRICNKGVLTGKLKKEWWLMR
jgi:hypothetical protein